MLLHRFRGPVKIVQIMQNFAHSYSAGVSSGSESDMDLESSAAPTVVDNNHPATTKLKLSLGSGCRVPRDIPHGFMPVYVGREKKRFVISTHYLSHRLFKALLKRSEEEFGFEYQGGLTIACEPVLFEHLLWLIGTNDPTARTTQLEDLLDFYDF